MLAKAIEMDRRFKEAKALLPHGEWGKWLVESVSYSQRKANKLMQLFEEYGDKLSSSANGGDNLNSRTWANLNYSQALLLLGIPEYEREEFILQHDVKDITTREMGQAHKERNQTTPEKKQAQVTPDSNTPGDIKIEYRTVKKRHPTKKQTPNISRPSPYHAV